MPLVLLDHVVRVEAAAGTVDEQARIFVATLAPWSPIASCTACCLPGGPAVTIQSYRLWKPNAGGGDWVGSLARLCGVRAPAHHAVDGPRVGAANGGGGGGGGEAGASEGAGQGARPAKWMMVLNPISGSGKSLDMVRSLVEPVLVAGGVEMVLQTTDYQGHATALARGLDAAEWAGIACCGGDGLVQEVVNGLLTEADGLPREQAVPLVPLPGGTDCAFVATLGVRERAGSNSIAASAFRSALAIVKGTRRPVDVMRVSSAPDATEGAEETFVTYSMCVVGFGFMANMVVAVEAARDTYDASVRTTVVGGYKLFTEPVRYYPAQVHYHSGETSMGMGLSVGAGAGGQGAGRAEGSGWSVLPDTEWHSVNVGCTDVRNFSTGAGSRFFPGTPIDDGTLRVICAGPGFSWMQSVELALRIGYNGTHPSMKGVIFRSGDEMILDRQGRLEDMLPLDIDGEVFEPKGRAVRVRCEHQRLTVVVF